MVYTVERLLPDLSGLNLATNTLTVILYNGITAALFLWQYIPLKLKTPKMTFQLLCRLAGCPESKWDSGWIQMTVYQVVIYHSVHIITGQIHSFVLPCKTVRGKDILPLPRLIRNPEHKGLTSLHHQNIRMCSQPRGYIIWFDFNCIFIPLPPTSSEWHGPHCIYNYFIYFITLLFLYSISSPSFQKKKSAQGV